MHREWTTFVAMPWAPSKRTGRVWLALLSVVGLGAGSGAGGWVQGAEEPGIAASLSLRPYPAQVSLRGPEAAQQLVVDGVAADGSIRDVTSQARFSSSAPAVATVDESGTITARGDGEASIQIQVGERTAVVPVSVRDVAAGIPVNFANQVVPIFTKQGCNAGGCHGKSGGQNGFRLSLLGFEPTLDYETLVKEGRGRRLFPAAPDRSLLLLKATARMPHGGGKRLDPNSAEYRLIRRWIALGMPVGSASDPTVARIEITPSARVLDRGGVQQLAVTAHYTDGSTEDVTRWAQYQSNDTEVAAVNEAGRVEARGLPGQAAVMARYQGQVAVFRATVPLGLPLSGGPEFPVDHPVDAAAARQWQALGIMPSDPCTDNEFIRRASLDITGALPAAEEVQAFVASEDPQKRARLIDRLLESPRYASYFAIKWADLLRNKREGNPAYQKATFGFHAWIRENLARNTPYDQIVRGVLTASGSTATAPPVQWYRRLRQPEAFVDDTAQVFLGMRLQCARCHHHPFEKWSQDDYFGFAAFFAKVGRKPDPQSQRSGRNDELIFPAKNGAVYHPKTGTSMSPKGLGEPEPAAITEGQDPRQSLADWMANPANPFFARALVNRYWAHFFGRGLVEPIDDLRETNPPSNPELLDVLANSFTRSGYDLKALVRLICTSRVYGLSSIPNEYNAGDKQSFARHYPKRMTAEVLLDAISDVAGTATSFAGLPPGTRAIEIPDESVGSSFLDTFGRPRRDTPCECERVTDASLSQSLMLLNSGEVQAKLTAAGGRADRLSTDPRPDEEKVRELFWMALARPPSAVEETTALEHLAKHSEARKSAYEDIIWALINAKEFQFVN